MNHVNPDARPVLNDKRLKALAHQWAKECGRRIQARRGVLGLTQAQLANAAGVTYQTVSKAELGEIVPKDATKWSIATALICEVHELWPAPDRGYVVSVARSEVPA